MMVFCAVIVVEMVMVSLVVTVVLMAWVVMFLLTGELLSLVMVVILRVVFMLVMLMSLVSVPWFNQKTTKSFRARQKASNQQYPHGPSPISPLKETQTSATSFVWALIATRSKAETNLAIEMKYDEMLLW